MSKFFEKKVEYSDDSGSSWEDLGHIRQDGTEDSTEAQSEAMSSGVELYAGTDNSYTVMVTDPTKKAALVTLQKDDSKQGTLQLRFTDAEGNTVVEEGFSVIVQDTKNFAPGKRNAFTTKWKRYFI